MLTYSDYDGWNEASFFYVTVDGMEYLRGTLSGLPRKDLTLSRRILEDSIME